MKNTLAHRSLRFLQSYFGILRANPVGIPVPDSVFDYNLLINSDYS